MSGKWVHAAITGCMVLFLAGSTFCPAQPSLEHKYWDEIFSPAYKTPTELPRKAPLRKELFDLLRGPVQEKAKQPVLFTGCLKVFKNWGFFTGSVLDKNAKPLGVEPMGNSDCSAIWLRTCKGWVLVDFSAGHSDVFQEVWHHQYGAPPALLGE